MNTLLDIARKRLNPGILIFNLDNRLMYANNEAFDILPALKKVKIEDSGRDVLPHEIFTLCDGLKDNRSKNPKAGEACSIIENHSGTSYSLRAFFLNESAGNTSTHIMVLIERIAEKHQIDFEQARGIYNFSRREIEVLRFLCIGESNRKIAEKLFISEFTVKDHLKSIMKKMNAKSRNEVIALLK